MVVSAVGMGRRILGVAGRAFNVDDALCLNDGATASTEWPGPRPGRDASSVRNPNAIRWMSGYGSSLRLEDLAGLEHRMHDHRQFACHGDGGPIEADPFAQLEPPCAQVALGPDAGQDDRRRFVEQPAQMPVAAPGDMAIIVDLSGWWCQTSSNSSLFASRRSHQSAQRPHTTRPERRRGWH